MGSTGNFMPVFLVVHRMLVARVFRNWRPLFTTVHLCPTTHVASLHNWNANFCSSHVARRFRLELLAARPAAVAAVFTHSGVSTIILCIDPSVLRVYSRK